MLKNETEYTEDTIKDLNRINFMYNIRFSRKFVNILAILGAVCEIFLAFLGALNIQSLCAIAILGILVLIVNTRIIPNILTRSYLKSNKNILGLKNVTIFSDEYIEVSNKQENSKVYYKQLYMAIETNNYIFLNVNKSQAIIVNKKNNTKKEIEDTSKILETKINKYIKYMVN